MHARVKQLTAMVVSMDAPWTNKGYRYVPESHKRHGDRVHGHTYSSQERALVTPRGKHDVPHCVYRR